MLHFAGFALDRQRVELRGPDGEAIKLRPQTFTMLTLFAANAGRALSKQELMDAVWPDVHVGDDSLFKCIRELRAALGDEQRQLIRLVSGHGYMLDTEVTNDPVATSQAPRALSPPAASKASAPSNTTNPAEPAIAPASPAPQSRLFGLRRPAAVVAISLLCAIIGLAGAAAAFMPGLIFKRSPPSVAVTIVDASNDPRGAALAAGVTESLLDGLAKIDNIRAIVPRAGVAAAAAELVSIPSTSTDFIVRGELQRGPQAWTLQARMIKTATGEVQSVATVSVDIGETNTQLLQSRLAAGAGHPLAVRLNELLQAGPSASNNEKVVIEQAMAAINQTSRERFSMAQAMLQKALNDEPDNVNLAVALAALQMRGIQMVWYSADEAVTAEANAGAALERALRMRPNSIAVLETSCRFLSATNRFMESLVTCSRALSFDPWNGLALYLVGLGQLNLGRFEDALATFERADRFDTPQVSRWTWLLGIGWANVMLGRPEEALPWLRRSIAITPASGRPLMLLAAVYQETGRINEARAAMAEGLKLRPGTTALNVAPPYRNSSPLFVESGDRILRLMIAAGLPER